MLAQAQSVTVTADAGPDESMSQTYMALDRGCRNLVNKRANPEETIAACKKVADEADRFAPQSHFITRRAAYVFYTISLIQGKKAQDAVTVGNKAVAVVLLGHDDGSGSSAAYEVRAQAEAQLGDLARASEDLNKAEEFERSAILKMGSAEDAFVKRQYVPVLKGMLAFHAQVLSALGKPEEATAKTAEAEKL